MSTMKRANIADLKLQDRNIVHNILVINQTDKDGILCDDTAGFKMIDTNTIGTSVSRNLALKNAEGDICIFADDDISYVEDYEKIISDCFSSYPEADIITFQIKTPDGSLFKRNYMRSVRWHNLRTVLKAASIEIAFKRDSVLRAGLSLDLEFGLGSRYRIHDDVIFLADAIKRNLKVLYMPIPIVIHPKESSGTQYSDFLIFSKGAAFYRIYHGGAYFIDFVYALKKYNEYRDKYTFMSFLKLMFKGSWEYKKTH